MVKDIEWRQMVAIFSPKVHDAERPSGDYAADGILAIVVSHVSESTKTFIPNLGRRTVQFTEFVEEENKTMGPRSSMESGFKT